MQQAQMQHQRSSTTINNLNEAEAFKQRQGSHVFNDINSHQLSNATPVMFVSKEQNVTADLYIESDAEEIYVPDRKGVKDNDPGDMSSYLKGFGGGANAIVGYQKYIHSASRIAQDNTDQDAPLFPDLAAFAEVSEGEEEDEEARINDLQKYSKFTFSGMSFKDYVHSIEQNLNEEMKKIVETYISQKVVRHPSIHLTQRKMQLKHPIFRLLTINALKYILDCAYLLKMKPG
jgi:hypothetical protein